DSFRQAAIPRRQDGGPQPLSFAQQRLWFLTQLAPASSAYNISRILRLAGRLDVGALSRSLREIIRRHEVLRTTFQVLEGEPVQVIGQAPETALPVVDLAALPQTARSAEGHRLALEEIRRPFDLSRDPSLRACLLRLGVEESLAVFTMHHIVCDDRSIGLLVRELMAFYEAFTTGRPAALPELPIQFADFARWQRDLLQGEILEEQLGYWKRQLADVPQVLELPTDRQRPAGQTFRGVHRQVFLPGALAESLRALGRERGATLFMTLLASLQTLLGRYAGVDDLLVGSPVTYRDREEVEPLIGFFVNALALRADLSGDPAFHDFLDRVRATALGAYAHQELPFERLVEELQPDRDLARPPLFQVMLVVQSASRGATLELPGLSLSVLPVETGTARIDLGFELIEHADGIVGEVEFNADLFEPATVERMVGHLSNLLEGIAADPGRRLSDLPLLTATERHQTLVEWTDSGPATSGTVHELFAERARLRPEDPAVIFQDTVVSYGELDRRSNALARRLLALGLAPESPVGLLSERSPEAIIGILGILKAGGCYVPLDPDYPADRLEMMLLDADVAAVVTQERFAPALAPLERSVVLLDEAGEGGPVPCLAGPDSPVYIIYTSGSMGRPKGVMVPHGSLVNFSRAIAGMVGLGPGERMLEFATLAFDASALQIFPTLLSGAALVLDLNPGRLAPSEIVELCERQGVTVLDLPAAVWRQWTEEMAESGERILPRVGAFLTGGESLTAEKLR
ncbi:MAG TPA: condensation domain-containing protein, partial [Thermoanaerobaculia bacterium]